MIDFLKKIDMFGVKSELLTCQKEKFTSWFGGLLTLFSLGLFCLMSFLMGRDFWFKTNPRVISNQIMPPKGELVYPTSLNFMILFRTETGDRLKIPDEENPIQPHFSYHHLKKGENKEWKMMASAYSPGTTCSDTAAVNNPDLPTLDLNEFRCIDWEDIAQTVNKDLKEGEEPYRPALGGSWEEDEVGFLSIYFSNSNILGDEDIKFQSDERISEFLGKGRRLASVYYPDSYFDPGNPEKPLNLYWKNIFYSLNSKLQRRDRFFFRINRLLDDIGWIFEETREFYSLANSEQQTEILIQEEDVASDYRRDFYTILFYVDRSQMEFKRAYMKIQELGAIVGSFMKGVQLVLVSLSALYANFRKNVFLYQKLSFKAETPDLSKKIALDKSNNFLEVKKQQSPQKPRLKLSFYKYLLISVSTSTKLDSNQEEMSNFKTDLAQSLDVENLFKLKGKIEAIERKMADSAVEQHN